MLFCQPTWADQVTYRSGSGGAGQATAAGTVLDFNGQYLVMQTAGGAEQRIPADRVLDIATSKTDEQHAAEAAADERDFRAAAENYLAALRAERRGWVQRQLMAECITSFLNSSQPDRACAGFLALAKQDSQPPYFSRIPLRWTPYQPSLPFQRQATTWLEDRQNSLASLLGASWLLSTQQRSAAIKTLQGLTIDPDARIVQLAQAQLWRTRVVTAKSGDSVDLRKLIDRIPAAVRGGPYFVLGRILSRQENHDSAALTYLRVPILHPTDRQLAAVALLSAGRELEGIDRGEEAKTLYREVARDFAETSAAGEAAGRLQQLLPNVKDGS